MNISIKLFCTVICIQFLTCEVAANIRGVPGIDYPNYSTIPKTSFKCSEQKLIPGFYADLETKCQVFHYCYKHRQESFLCPAGTIFNQELQSCDYWYSSECNIYSTFHNSNRIKDEVKFNDIIVDKTSNNVFEKMAALYKPEESLKKQSKFKSVLPLDERFIKKFSEKNGHYEFDSSDNLRMLDKNIVSVIPLTDHDSIKGVGSKDLNYVKYKHDVENDENVDILFKDKLIPERHSGDNLEDNYYNLDLVKHRISNKLKTDMYHLDASFDEDEESSGEMTKIVHFPDKQKEHFSTAHPIALTKSSDLLDESSGEITDAYNMDQDFEQVSTTYSNLLKQTAAPIDFLNSQNVLSKRFSTDVIPIKKKLRRKPTYVVFQTEDLNAPAQSVMKNKHSSKDTTNFYSPYIKNSVTNSVDFPETTTLILTSVPDSVDVSETTTVLWKGLPVLQKRNRKPPKILPEINTTGKGSEFKNVTNSVMPANIMTAYHSSAGSIEYTPKPKRRKPILVEEAVYDATDFVTLQTDLPRTTPTVALDTETIPTTLTVNLETKSAHTTPTVNLDTESSHERLTVALHTELETTTQEITLHNVITEATNMETNHVAKEKVIMSVKNANEQLHKISQNIDINTYNEEKINAPSNTNIQQNKQIISDVKKIDGNQIGQKLIHKNKVESATIYYTNKMEENSNKNLNNIKISKIDSLSKEEHIMDGGYDYEPYQPSVVYDEDQTEANEYDSLEDYLNYHTISQNYQEEMYDTKSPNIIDDPDTSEDDFVENTMEDLISPQSEIHSQAIPEVPSVLKFPPIKHSSKRDLRTNVLMNSSGEHIKAMEDTIDLTDYSDNFELQNSNKNLNNIEIPKIDSLSKDDQIMDRGYDYEPYQPSVLHDSQNEANEFDLLDDYLNYNTISPYYQEDMYDTELPDIIGDPDTFEDDSVEITVEDLITPQSEIPFPAITKVPSVLKFPLVKHSSKRDLRTYVLMNSSDEQIKGMEDTIDLLDHSDNSKKQNGSHEFAKNSIASDLKDISNDSKVSSTKIFGQDNENKFQEVNETSIGHINLLMDDVENSELKDFEQDKGNKNAHSNLQPMEQSELSEVNEIKETVTEIIDSTSMHVSGSSDEVFHPSSIPLPTNAFEKDVYIKNLHDLQQNKSKLLQSDGIYPSTFKEGLSKTAAAEQLPDMLQSHLKSTKFGPQKSLQKTNALKLIPGLLEVKKVLNRIKTGSTDSQMQNLLGGLNLKTSTLKPFQLIQNDLLEHFHPYFSNFNSNNMFSVRSGKKFSQPKLMKIMDFGKKLLSMKREKLNLLKKYLDSFNVINEYNVN